MHISSKWRFYRYLDGTFHVYEMNTPIGKINQLPEYVLKGSNQKALINMKKMLISYVCGDVQHTINQNLNQDIQKILIV